MIPWQVTSRSSGMGCPRTVISAFFTDNIDLLRGCDLRYHLCVQTTQITMTTGRLLLLLLIVSSQSVDSQSTNDDETCDEAGLLSELRRDIERLLDNQQRLQLQLQTLTTSRKSYAVI